MTGVTKAAIGLVMLAGLTAAQAVPSDLFISEYIEGSGNNKAIELFNGTGAAIDLDASSYSLSIYFNGSTSAGSTIPLTGSVADGDVFVIADNNADAAILAVTDQTSTSNFFNGDDVVALLKGGVFVDVFGQIGTDPGSGWGSGSTFAQNNTLRRQSSVEAGDTNATDPFDPAAEWQGSTQDDFSDLGSHTFAGGGGTPGGGGGGGAAAFELVAFTSFEEPADGGRSNDTDLSDHELSNADGSTVFYAGGSELGFRTFLRGASDDGVDNDFIGVTNFTGEVGSFTDGSQGYELVDPDGILSLQINPVAITSGKVELDLFVADTSYESADFIDIFLEDALGVRTTVFSTIGQDIDDLGIEGDWLALEQEFDGFDSQVQLFVEFQSNSNSEAIYVDNVRFFQPVPVPEPLSVGLGGLGLLALALRRQRR